MNAKINSLKIKLFADGADISGMQEMNEKPYIKGLTTNPTLMKKVGISNYKSFASEVLKFVTSKPISFEVFSDEFREMERQALEIASWGSNVYVKIPVTNTKGESAAELVQKLTNKGVQVNVTALMTLEQVSEISQVLSKDVPSYVSVFAGRIADTGRDPVPYITESVSILREIPKCELIWASPRELLNVFQADRAGCHVITATNDILTKLKLIDYPLQDYSLDTVKMFYNDSLAAGFQL
jgi:transaldolase